MFPKKRDTDGQQAHEIFIINQRMQIKTTMRHHLTPVRIVSASLQITNVERSKPLYPAGGIRNWCSHWGKVWRFLKTLKIKLPCDTAIPLPCICKKQNKKSNYFKKIHAPQNSEQQ